MTTIDLPICCDALTESERKHRRLVREIEQWANERQLKNRGKKYTPDNEYYKNKAMEYMRLRNKYNNESLTIDEQNVISVKMRTIESRFIELQKEKNKQNIKIRWESKVK